MGRRMIERKTWKSFQVGQLTMRQRILWIGLITVADDQGRGYAHPGVLRGEIFPYDDLGNDDVKADLEVLAGLGLIHLYEKETGAPLYQIVSWWKYQRPTWAWPSDLPAPEGWSDRERYRRGNEVMENGWDGDGGFTSAHSDPTVTSQRGHDEASPSTSGSTSTNGNTSGSSAPGCDDSYETFRVYENATARPLTRLLTDNLSDLIDECEEHRQSLPPPVKGADHTGDQWVCSAIQEAVKSSDTGRININFVTAILDRWMDEGFEAPFKGNGTDTAARNEEVLDEWLEENA